MGIVDIQPPDNPDDKFVWGFDDEQGKWVPVDRSAHEGGTIGNLGGAAGRGFEGVGLGILELLGLSNPEEIKSYEERKRAAQAVAPIAESIGGFAPEAVAGGAAALATGGMSVPLQLGAEFGAVGLTSAMRPGDLETRLKAGVESGALQLLGSAAVRGIFAGVTLGRQVVNAGSDRVAAGVEAGAARVQASELERAAVEAEARQAAGAAAPEGIPAGEPGAGPGSVGAARTAPEQLGQEFSEASAAAERTGAAGAETFDDPAVQRLADRAQDLGLRTTGGFGSRQGSAARLMQSVHEMNPFGDIVEQQIKAGNQRRAAELLETALGSDSPKGSIHPDDLGKFETDIGRRFDQVEALLPQMPGVRLGDALEAVSELKVPGGRSSGQKYIDNMIEDIRAGPEKFTGEQWMQMRRNLAGEQSRLFAKGDTTGGEALLKAVTAMDRVTSQTLHQARRGKLLDYWERSRRQYQVLMAAKRPGAISPTGDVNPNAVFRGLAKDRDKGGFGYRGPKAGTPERDVFDAMQILRINESGVPATGVRRVIQESVRSTAGKTVAAGGAGLLGLNIFR